MSTNGMGTRTLEDVRLDLCDIARILAEGGAVTVANDLLRCTDALRRVETAEQEYAESATALAEQALAAYTFGR